MVNEPLMDKRDTIPLNVFPLPWKGKMFYGGCLN